MINFIINIGKSYGNHIRNKILEGNFDTNDTENQVTELLSQIGESQMIKNLSITFMKK